TAVASGFDHWQSGGHGDDGRSRRARARDAADDEGGLRRRAAGVPRARQALLRPSRPPRGRDRPGHGGPARRRPDVPRRRPRREGAPARGRPRPLLHDAALRRLSGGAAPDPRSGASRSVGAGRHGRRGVADSGPEPHRQGVARRARTRGDLVPAASQAERAETFRALHAGKPFVIPNPWDAGSARVLAALGFQALASTSSGFAFALGRRDGETSLDEVVEHTAVLASSTALPLSVDLENGYGPQPESAALAVQRIGEAGAVGGSIEDWEADEGIYELELAVERVTAAV